MSYTHTITVPLAWDEALQQTKDALATFEAKLGPEAAATLGDYIILGACNPNLASRALAAEPDMGALLPCNVVVRRSTDASETTIQAIDPQTMVQLSDNPAVKDVADDAATRLRAALARLDGSVSPGGSAGQGGSAGPAS